MKTRIVLLSVFLLSAFIFISEQTGLSQGPETLDSINTILSGKWVWDSCYGGLSGICTEGPGPGNQRSVIFSKTSTDSIAFDVYRNDTLIFSGITKLRYNDTPNDDKWIIETDVVHGAEFQVPGEYYSIRFMDTGRLEFILPCDDCHYYIYIKENVPTLIDRIEPEPELLAFPNPTEGMLYIRNMHSFAGIEIVDISGKVLLNKSLSPEAGHVLDIAYLTRGIYFVRLISGKRVIIQKIIKR